MIGLLWFGLALAHPPDALARAEEPLSVRSFLRLVGDGPVWGYGPRRAGPVTAWIFPDGVVEHAEIRKGSELQEIRRFDALGRALSTTTFADGAPHTVTVHQPEATFEVTAWTRRDLDGVALRWPEVTDAHRMWAEVIPSASDPTAPAFRDGLVAGCGCTIEHATAAWIAGRPGVRFRVRLHAPGQPYTGEVWAASDGTRTLLLSVLVPAHPDSGPIGGAHALALGRAVAALATFEDSP